jgi:predicted MPP superfamily phosphohydrolase
LLLRANIRKDTAVISTGNRKKRMSKVLYGCYLTFFVMMSLWFGFGYHEGSSTAVTMLQVEGAPDGVVFIADPHLRESNADQVREAVDRINALHPSLVLIGGDFTCSGGEDFSLQEVWSGIDAPVYAVLGNHDYRTGMSAEENLRKMQTVARARLRAGEYDTRSLQDETVDRAYADRLVAVLEQQGVRVLRNECIQLSVNGRDVMIVGVDDGWAGMADPPTVPETDTFTIYLIHEPECRGNWPADLVLAGHTHGGQVIPAGLDRLVTGDRFRLSGRIDEDGSVIYITRGLATSSSRFPFRFFASPEIVMIRSL